MFHPHPKSHQVFQAERARKRVIATLLGLASRLSFLLDHAYVLRIYLLRIDIKGHRLYVYINGHFGQSYLLGRRDKSKNQTGKNNPTLALASAVLDDPFQRPTKEGFNLALADLRKSIPEECISLDPDDLRYLAASPLSCECDLLCTRFLSQIEIKLFILLDCCRACGEVSAGSHSVSSVNRRRR